MSDPTITQLAHKLAEDCIAVQEKTGDYRLFIQLGEVLGASSQTLEEAFMTAVRTRMAEAQGRAFLMRKLKEHHSQSGQNV